MNFEFRRNSIVKNLRFGIHAVYSRLSRKQRNKNYESLTAIGKNDCKTVSRFLIKKSCCSLLVNFIVLHSLDAPMQLTDSDTRPVKQRLSFETK